MRILIFVLALASQTLPAVLGPSKVGGVHGVSGSENFAHDEQDEQGNSSKDKKKDKIYIYTRRVITT